MNVKCNGQLVVDEDAELYQFFGFEIGFYSPAAIKAAISALPAGEELVLEINSVGGSIMAANEIYSDLEGCPNPTRAVIQSLAASAASYFPLACDRVEMSLPAQMMIHQAHAHIEGNKADHRWIADQLEVGDSGMLDVYCKKCGAKATREELQQLMEEETYLGSRRCLELGLVDGIIGENTAPAEPEQASPTAFAASVAGNIITAMAVLPTVAELKARRDREQSWKNTAARELAAEKNKTWKG